MLKLIKFIFAKANFSELYKVKDHIANNVLITIYQNLNDF